MNFRGIIVGLIVIIVTIIIGLYFYRSEDLSVENKDMNDTSIIGSIKKVMRFNIFKEKETFEDFVSNNLGRVIFLIGYISQKDDIGDGNKDISDDMVILTVVDIREKPVVRQFKLNLQPTSEFVEGNYALEGILQENGEITDAKMRFIGVSLNSLAEYTFDTSLYENSKEKDMFSKIISAVGGSGYSSEEYYVYEKIERARDDNSVDYLLVNKDTFRVNKGNDVSSDKDIRVSISGEGEVKLQKTTVALPE